jgi:hypothetical protein
MKAHREGDKFRPVVITLESQAEVDALYAMLNHTVVSDDTALSDAHEEVEPFKTAAAEHVHDAITKRAKAFGKP